MRTDGEPEFPLIAACAIPISDLQLIAQLSSVVAQTKVSLEGISLPILWYSFYQVWNSLHPLARLLDRLALVFLVLYLQTKRGGTFSCLLLPVYLFTSRRL